jgi:hypothetical protein
VSRGWLLLAALAAMAGAPLAGAAPAGTGAALLASADAIVAVEILDTDYTATASDGPMYAQTRILGVVRGPLVGGTTLRVGESAWCGPDYERRERRILFLRRVTSRTYFRTANWSTVCTPGDRLNVFFDPATLTRLSPEALRMFLAGVQAARRTPPRVRAAVAARERSALLLSFALENPRSVPLWLNPALINVGFDARGIRLYRKPKFAGAPRGWFGLPPRQTITGTIRVAGREVRGESRVTLQVSHNAVYFPHASWAGTATAGVRLEP